MSTKIGSPEWIENVTKKYLDNRVNKINPNIIRDSKRPGSEAATQSITAIGYGILAAGIATGIAISSMASSARKHMPKKQETEEEPLQLIDITPVVVEEKDMNSSGTDDAARCV